MAEDSPSQRPMAAARGAEGRCRKRRERWRKAAASGGRTVPSQPNQPSAPPGRTIGCRGSRQQCQARARQQGAPGERRGRGRLWRLPRRLRLPRHNRASHLGDGHEGGGHVGWRVAEVRGRAGRALAQELLALHLGVAGEMLGAGR